MGAEGLFLEIFRVIERSQQWSVGEYHGPEQFVVAGDIKSSAGGSITPSCNGYSATYRTGV